MLRKLFPTAGSSSRSKTMTDKKSSKNQTPTINQLPLANLKTVKWLQDQQPLMNIYEKAANRYVDIRQMILFGWFVLIMEIFVVWWWTFYHNIRLPEIMAKIITNLDNGAVYTLEAVQRRADWWQDAAGVRFMWFKESVVFFLDKNLTTADKYFVILQDRIYIVFNFCMSSVRYIGSNMPNFVGQNTVLKSKPVSPPQKNGSIRRNSEGYEAEDLTDFPEEDYLSDASMDSRRLMKEDSRGQLYTRLHTTAKAEGKFRDAMYFRVKNELDVMRKNSIRFSTGIVNCVRQMVALPTQEGGNSSQDLVLRIAKKLRILDLILTLKENLSGQPFLAKPIILVRVLSEAWLAFLLRLVKVKKSRRSRSMRSESLRRRALGASGMSNHHQLSPAALQQSSEPVLPHQLPATLPGRVQKLEEEDLGGFLSKDSALGSEDCQSEEALQSDGAVANIDAEQESDYNVDKHSLRMYNEGDDPDRPRPVHDSSLCSGRQNDIGNTSLCSGRQSPTRPIDGRHSALKRTDDSQIYESKKSKSTKPKHVTIM